MEIPKARTGASLPGLLPFRWIVTARVVSVQEEHHYPGCVRSGGSSLPGLLPFRWSITAWVASVQEEHHYPGCVRSGGESLPG